MVCMVEYNTTFSLDSVLFFMGLKIAELGEYSMSIPSMVLLWGLFVSLSPRNTTQIPRQVPLESSNQFLESSINISVVKQ